MIADTDASPTDRLIDAALALAPEHGWRRLSLRAVAEKAGVPLCALPAELASSADLFAAFARRIDRETLRAVADLSLGESERDRLFECVMARFDALTPHRDAVARALKDFRRDPAAIALGFDLLRSMRRSLEAAGFATVGVRGALLAQATATAFMRTLPAWVDDDDGLSKTMAALDARLRKLFKPRRARLVGLAGA